MPLNRSLSLTLLVLLWCCLGQAHGGNRQDQDKVRRAAAETHVQLGQGYFGQGKLDIAMQKLKRALELDPKFPSAHTMIAVLYERINDIESAALHYKKAAELAPKDGSILNNYGTFLCHQGNPKKADEYFAKALKDPFYQTPAVAYSNRGLCALQTQSFELAESNLRQAIKLRPDFDDALYGLAQVLYHRGQYMLARAFIQRYEGTASPATAESLLLGMLIEKGLGNKPSVEEYRKRLIEEFPNSEAVQNLSTEN